MTKRFQQAQRSIQRKIDKLGVQLCQPFQNNIAAVTHAGGAQLLAAVFSVTAGRLFLGSLLFWLRCVSKRTRLASVSFIL